MSKKTFLHVIAAMALALPTAANAHRAWMLPSATIFSGTDHYVTVDAAVSNDLFYFEHNPMRLDGLAITAPDATTIAPEHASTGKYRTTFDVPLKMVGTYRLAIASEGAFARYKINGETKRWRGKLDDVGTAVPAGAEDVQVTYSQRRIETFVSVGKPNMTALKPAGKGLELEFITHPNDLVTKSEASFKFLLDGKPAANAKVVLIRGGNRYRDSLGEINVTTDAEGVFKFKATDAGMYWISASAEDKNPGIKGVHRRTASYAATLEILPD